jgi:serine/threonine-protein kinase
MVTSNVRLIEKLGQGGMGSVWLAENTSLERKVAVKFITAELSQHQQLVSRFKHEASIAAKITSPHVVQIFDHGLMEDETPYIVMELLTGEALTDKLVRDGAMSLDEVALLAAQTCKVLHEAHELGVVHRDIKPDNLYLTDSGYDMFVKVLDFGVAKQTGLPQKSVMTATGALVGTPDFMSPEQIVSSKGVDFRADLWALAVVCYHCLTGQLPFHGETLGGICVAIASAEFAPPSTHRPPLGPMVDAFFAKAMNRDPNARHSSAMDFAKEIRELAANHTMGDASTDPATGALRATPPDARVSGVDGLGGSGGGVSASGATTAMPGATPPGMMARTIPSDVPLGPGPSHSGQYQALGPSHSGGYPAMGQEGTLVPNAHTLGGQGRNNIGLFIGAAVAVVGIVTGVALVMRPPDNGVEPGAAAAEAEAKKAEAEVKKAELELEAKRLEAATKDAETQAEKEKRLAAEAKEERARIAAEEEKKKAEEEEAEKKKRASRNIPRTTTGAAAPPPPGKAPPPPPPPPPVAPVSGDHGF